MWEEYLDSSNLIFKLINFGSIEGIFWGTLCGSDVSVLNINLKTKNIFEPCLLTMN